MPLSHHYFRRAACLSALLLVAGCGTHSDDGEVLVVPVADVGQACTASADCVDDLACMTIPAGRVCAESCQETSDCAQADAQCVLLPGGEIGYCDVPEEAADAPPVDETPADETPADETPGGETPDEETPVGEPPVNEPPVDEPPTEDPNVRSSYPEGPFGMEVGDVIENHTMVDSDGAPVTLGDLRADASVNILIIFNGVTYCRGCMAKTADLTELYNELGGQGLLPVVALYENNDYAPAQGPDALRYQEMLGLEFPVLADGNFVFHPYFAERGHPLILVLDAEDMTILYKRVHWRRDDVEAVIRPRLLEE